MPSIANYHDLFICLFVQWNGIGIFNEAKTNCHALALIISVFADASYLMWFWEVDEYLMHEIVGWMLSTLEILLNYVLISFIDISISEGREKNQSSIFGRHEKKKKVNRWLMIQWYTDVRTHKIFSGQWQPQMNVEHAYEILIACLHAMQSIFHAAAQFQATHQDSIRKYV